MLVRSAAADPRPPADPPKSMLGVYVDGKTNGATVMRIDCGGDNVLDGPEGDGTLFIAEVEPGRYRCFIDIIATP
jgi:hypothetical protein